MRSEYAAKTKASDLEYRARLSLATEQAKSTIATKTDELKQSSRELRKSRSEGTSLLNLVGKLETANIRLKSCCETQSTLEYQRNIDIKDLQVTNKRRKQESRH